MGITQKFWKGKRVFLTGHTGFKGAWTSIILQSLGAEVVGYSLAPESKKCLYSSAKLSSLLYKEYIADINNLNDVNNAVKASSPEILIHMAAQSLVIEGYQQPVATFMTNIQGSVHILDAIRQSNSIKAAVIVTTDKCYENIESSHGYTESDRLGGHDPYSSSKACTELVTSSYRDSFFSTKEKNIQVASARAGNVIGGGDWAENRLIPDCIRSFTLGVPVELRSPQSIRPWQHVLEPISGYLRLAECLYSDSTRKYDSAWNFGPNQNSEIPAITVAKSIAKSWGNGAEVKIAESTNQYKETSVLRLDSNKARQLLHWEPKWSIDETLLKTASWYKQFSDGGDALKISENQIQEYFQA